MFMQKGDRGIAANVGKTVLILVVFMVAAMIVANLVG